MDLKLILRRDMLSSSECLLKESSIKYIECIHT